MILKAVSSFPPFCLLSSHHSGDWKSPFSSYQSAVIAFYSSIIETCMLISSLGLSPRIVSQF